MLMSGKRAGWLVTTCVVVQFFLLFGPLYNYSILFVSFREEFQTSAALTGWVGSLENGLLSFFSPLGGVLLKRLSHRSVCLLALTVYSLGCLTTSFVPNIYWAFLTVGVMMAFGAGANMHSSTCLLFEWYPGKNNARATCLSLLGTSIGFLAFAPLKTRLSANYGWRNMMRIISGGVFVLGILSALFLVPPSAREQRPAEAEEDSASPAADACLDETQPEEGTTKQSQGTADKATDAFQCEDMDGETEQEGGREVASSTSEAGADPDLKNAKHNKETAVTERHTKGLSKMIRQVDVWLFVLSQLFAMTGWTFVTINFASYMKNLGFSTDQTSLAIIIFSVAEIFGKIVIASVGDHLPFLQVNVMAISSMFAAMAAGFLTIATSLTDIIILSVVCGFLRALFLGIAFSASFQLFSAYGGDAVASLVLVPYGLGPMIGAPLTGFLFDISGNYTLSLLFLVGVFVKSTVFILIITLRRYIATISSCKRTATTRNKDRAHQVKTDGDGRLPMSAAENKAYTETEKL